VTEDSKRDLANSSFFGGLLLLLCALTFYYFAVLRIDYQKTTLLDLGPYPDATEYFAQARALSKGRSPSIQIGYDELPSRYPFGYSALMLPWLKILPAVDAVLAPFRTNQTLGLLLLLAVFAFYVYLAMPLTGGVAALLLATLPGFFTFCRSSLSDLSASLFVVLAFMLAYLGFKEERRWKLYLSAVLLGLSLNVRIQSLFFAPLLLVMALLPVRGMRWRWFLHCAALPVVFLLAASPVLLLNTIQFHSPFKTGYDFWVPYFTENHLLFSFRYIPGNALALWKESTLQPHEFVVGNIFGIGTYFVPAFLLLACTGLFFIPRNWFVGCAFLAGLSYSGAALFFLFSRDARLYLPILILLVAVAALPVTWAAKNLLAGKRTVLAITLLILFAGACLGYPSRSGFNTSGINWLQAWEAVHFSSKPRESKWYIAQGRFLEAFGREPGIVLSDIDPVYLNAFFPEWIAAVPVDGKHHYGYSRIWRYARPQALALVKRGLDQRHAVYALFVSQKDMEENKARLPALDGYEWAPAETSARKVVILKLNPNAG
jgi:4-amino-4-deoxy-L-arabinose transferase-like glycosyltransferase